MRNVSVKDLVYMAFYVALFMVLDTFVNTLHIIQMPNGGSLGYLLLHCLWQVIIWDGKRESLFLLFQYLRNL